MKALVLRLSAIGDVVHTLPAAAALRGAGWEVDWLVEPPARPLLEGNPLVSRVVTAPSSRAFRLSAAREALRQVRAASYDVALDVQGLWKSAAWGRLGGVGRIVGYGRRWRREPASALLIHERVELPAAAGHVIDENLALLRPLGIEALGRREFAFPPAPDAAGVVGSGLARLALSDFAVLNAGGGWAAKLWPPEGFGAVARGLRERGLGALVTWGPGEESLADRVVAASDGAAVRCFPTTLLELVEVIRRARLMVAADTGPLHIACALGVPVVGIYGETDPLRNGPFAAADVVVRREGPPDPRRRGRFLVSGTELAALPPAEVLAAVDRRLARVAASTGARAV